ncbi:MAG: hypothetical protein R3A79_05460 [Nannocystaceae bacterium]
MLTSASFGGAIRSPASGPPRGAEEARTRPPRRAAKPATRRPAGPPRGVLGPALGHRPRHRRPTARRGASVGSATLDDVAAAEVEIAPVTTIEAELAFTRPEDVRGEAGPGPARAETLSREAFAETTSHDRRRCAIRDLAAPGGLLPDLCTHGFDLVDLSRRARLQAALERARAAGSVDEAGARTIRRALVGRVLPLRGGRRLLLLFIAPEGFIMRRGGPAGIAVDAPAGPPAMNGHDAAMAVHADQDVDGTPVRQLLRGAAPWLFRHDSPTRHNHRSPVALVNLWIPLDQVTRPLAVMDKRSLDRRAHQLRYGLPTDGFLDRPAATRINDIWSFLHDDAQRWHFASAIDARTAFVFDTLSTPHGAFKLPGEGIAAARYRQLRAVIAAVDAGDREAAARAVDAPLPRDLEAPQTEPLRQAIAAIEAALADARGRLDALTRGEGAATFSANAAAIADRVVRKSIEMRGVALVLPRRRGRRPDPSARTQAAPSQVSTPRSGS